ncbi:hypothetical protein BC832DRAFT_623213 [Gaertneriomyces semiglobifer]|nr:hypothetical protein BC832DRAFT_623213 [Gaertneriomyces semiglobifer]
MTSTVARREVLGLYRSLIRVQKAFPRQDARPVKFNERLLERIRHDFRAPCENPEESLQKGHRELQALKRILNNEFEKQYGPADSSPLRAYLPSEKTFALLDQESRNVLQQQGTVSFLKDYLASKFER